MSKATVSWLGRQPVDGFSTPVSSSDPLNTFPLLRPSLPHVPLRLTVTLV